MAKVKRFLSSSPAPPHPQDLALIIIWHLLGSSSSSNSSSSNNTFFLFSLSMGCFRNNEEKQERNGLYVVILRSKINSFLKIFFYYWSFLRDELFHFCQTRKQTSINPKKKSWEKRVSPVPKAGQSSKAVPGRKQRTKHVFSQIFFIITNHRAEKPMY